MRRPRSGAPKRCPANEPNAGAVAFSREGSPELGEFEEAEILKTFGDVPDDFHFTWAARAHMTRRKGELAAGRIDREWPHQVALRADQVMGKNYAITYDFCRDLSLCPRGHTVQRDNVTYNVFCFADPGHADRFRERFNGERFDPKERGRGSEWFRWRSA